MVYQTTTDNPPRFQWEPSSGTFTCSQSVNCGPTGSTQQADFYRDRLHQIERVRTSAGVAACRPTTATEQAAMLSNRGVPAKAVQINSLEELDKLLGPRPARRPIGIGVYMGRLTAQTRGHSFTGWHRLTILRTARRMHNGKMRRGYLYTDPNFSPPGGNRPDPMKGRRFITRAELKYAFIENSPRYLIVPERRKRVPSA